MGGGGRHARHHVLDGKLQAARYGTLERAGSTTAFLRRPRWRDWNRAYLHVHLHIHVTCATRAVRYLMRTSQHTSLSRYLLRHISFVTAFRVSDDSF